MRTRARLLLGAGLLVLAAALGYAERRSAHTTSFYRRDSVQSDALLSSRAALELRVLEARAGLLWNFDAIDRALGVLRATASEARIVRARGVAYAAAADELAQAAEALRLEEPVLEAFKTDLALLRLASQQFETVVEEILLRTSRSAATAPVASPPRVAHGLPLVVLSQLRADMARYERTATRRAAQRVEVAIPLLETMVSELDDSGVERAELSILLGNVRAILARRERVDGFARTLADSPVRARIHAASALYERAARKQTVLLVVLRVATCELAIAGLILLALAGRRAVRESRSRVTRLATR